MFSLRRNNDFKKAKHLLVSEFIETPYLLFLDFDGVLHPEYEDGVLRNELFCKLPMLEAWLREHIEITIVLTTAWRKKQDLKKLREYFSDDIQCRIIGMTPDTSQGFKKNGRYYEIKMFLMDCGWSNKNYAILDDRSDIFPEHCDRLVLTNTRDALQNEHLDALSKILNL